MTVKFWIRNKRDKKDFLHFARAVHLIGMYIESCEINELKVNDEKTHKPIKEMVVELKSVFKGE